MSCRPSRTKSRQILKQSDAIREIAMKYSRRRSMLFLGRQNNYPVALEGALKMKEISYIYASGHASAELKHGIIALVKPELPSVFIAPTDHVYDKNVSNIEEVKARRGPIIAIATEGNTEIGRIADDVIYIPACHEHLTPLADGDSVATAGLSFRRRPGLRCRQATQSCKKRDG